MVRRTTPDLRRRRPLREPKRRFIFFCEGKKTEPSYFKVFQQSFQNALIEVEIAPEAGVPRTLAEAAADKAKELGLSSRRKPLNSFEEHDEVWAVFDRDEHPHFEDAIALCNSRGVRVARSNPCFELWLILHGQDYDRPDDRATVQAHLRKLRPEYDPSAGKTPHCADLVTQVEIAERRAEAQLAHREAEGAAFGRPSTTVGWLTQAIRFAAEKRTPR
jgi:hypothetical protein